MRRATKTCLCATALLVLALTGLTAHAESTYYRWQDDRGNPVHSDRPPPTGTAYEVITSGSSLVRKVDADEGAVPATTEPTVSNDFQPVDANKKSVKKNAEQCKRARENLQTLIEQHVSGKWDHSYRLWAMLCLELWQRTYLDPEVAPSSAPTTI